LLVAPEAVQVPVRVELLHMATTTVATVETHVVLILRVPVVVVVVRQ
jgi:hypothetical protein